jgi:hypothetical protein
MFFEDIQKLAKIVNTQDQRIDKFFQPNWEKRWIMTTSRINYDLKTSQN